MARGFGHWCALVVAACVLMVTGRTVAQQTEVAERAIVFGEVKKLLEEADTFKAIEYVNQQGLPEVVAERYAELVTDFYWRDKALERVVTFARAGIQYCLTKAQELNREDVETARKLQIFARVISYNLASFAWPGWDEEGIVVSDRALAAGLDAARLNLRLTTELGEGPEKLSNAYWVLGAQLLAAGDHAGAVEAFGQCEAKGAEAEDHSLELLGSGYKGIAMIVGGQPAGRELLEAAVAGFEELDTEDSPFFIDQLNTAMKVFAED
jgi:hypothetical protein